MPTLTLSRGERVWYRKSGAGPPLLHIHGSAFGHRDFEAITPSLARSFEVIDFDLPGYGESRHSADRSCGLTGMAGEIRELVQALGYDRVHVHGRSLGAALALTIAALHPEMVDRLVLSSFLIRPDAAARRMRQVWKLAAQDSGMAAVADLSSAAGFSRGYQDRAGADAHSRSMRAAFSRNTASAFIVATEAVEAADLLPLVAQVTAPTLLLAGREDMLTPFSPAPSGIGIAQIAGRIENARTVLLDDCGHFLLIEQPARAVEEIAAFLRA